MRLSNITLSLTGSGMLLIQYALIILSARHFCIKLFVSRNEQLYFLDHIP